MKKVLVKLATRLIGFKAMLFTGSNIFLLNVPMIAIPIDILCSLQKKLMDSIGIENTFHLLYRLGKKHGYNGSEIYLKKFNISSDERDFSFFLEQAEILGIGKLKIEKLKSPETIVNNYSIFCDEYKRKYGEQIEACGFYQLGLVTGAANLLLKDNLNGKEIKCICKGDTSCKYLLHRQEIPYKITNFELDEKLKKVENFYRTSDLILNKISIRDQKSTYLYDFIKKYKKENLFRTRGEMA